MNNVEGFVKVDVCVRTLTKAFGFLIVGMALQLFAGCGVSTPVTPALGSALNGNWNIVGAGLYSTAPSISLSIVVVGTQIYANGLVGIACSGQSTGGGGSTSFSGVLESDGSFTLTQPSGVTLGVNGNVLTIVVTGTVPATGSSPWSGTYSMTTAPGAVGCIVNETGSFTAASIPALSGTYAGSLSSNLTSNAITASVSLSQGAAQMANQVVGGVIYYLPVTGTITVTGVSCFSHGSISSTSISKVAGDSVALVFTMDDGSTLAVTGNLQGSSVAQIQQISLSVLSASTCKTAYFGTLTKQ